MSALPVLFVYLIIDAYGLPVGGAWLSQAAAKKHLTDADDEFPARGPHRVVTYRVTP